VGDTKTPVGSQEFVDWCAWKDALVQWRWWETVNDTPCFHLLRKLRVPSKPALRIAWWWLKRGYRR
jgi:hypothetical protein